MGLKSDFLFHGKNINLVLEQSVQKNIWTQEGASDTMFEKTAESGTS